MKREQFLKTEIDMIEDLRIKQWVIDTLKNVPDLFFTRAASSTGKYHPDCTNRPHGLLVHTKRTVFLANHLCTSHGVHGEERDQIVAACILHDIAKCDGSTKEEAMNHPLRAKEYYALETPDFLETYIKNIDDCVKYHMGLWTPSSIAKHISTYAVGEMIVYISDYLAACKELVTPVDQFVFEE